MAGAWGTLVWAQADAWRGRWDTIRSRWSRFSLGVWVEADAWRGRWDTIRSLPVAVPGRRECSLTRGVVAGTRSAPCRSRFQVGGSACGRVAWSLGHDPLPVVAVPGRRECSLTRGGVAGPRSAPCRSRFSLGLAGVAAGAAEAVGGDVGDVDPGAPVAEGPLQPFAVVGEGGRRDAERQRRGLVHL